MSHSESIKKMLRSVLQSSKEGVPISRLQSEYRSLCGESIPLKMLGHSRLEDYLRSIPSVVRLEHCKDEMKCFAAVCQETAHIAELVARQKNSKKSGRSQVVNCKMRFKPTNPYMLSVRPRSSLRQPSAAGASNWTSNRSRSHGGYRGFSASGDYRKSDQSLSPTTPIEHRNKAPQPAANQRVVPERKSTSFANCQKPKENPTEPVSRLNQSKPATYDRELVQSRLTQLLKKHSCGLWMSKLSEVYRNMFSQKLHPQALIDLKTWTHICMVEKPSSAHRADQLIYPPLPPKPSSLPRHGTTPPTSSTETSRSNTPVSSEPSSPKQPSTPSPFPSPRVSPQNSLAKPTFIFPPKTAAASPGKLLSSVSFRNLAHKPPLTPCPRPHVGVPLGAHSQCKSNHNLPSPNLKQNTLAPTWTRPPSNRAPPLASSLQTGPDIKRPLSPSSVSAPCPPSKSTVSPEVRERIKELLLKYSHGLWVHALPKLFMDTYKTPFPEHILDNLSLLLDIWRVEYPISHDKGRAILYYASQEDKEATESQDGQPLPSGLTVVAPVVPPCLVLPPEQYPSVLITDAKNSNAVTIRYVGESYSNAQEAMEEAMQFFYSHSSAHRPLSNPVVGQLVAIRGEDGDELSRAQVTEVVAPDKVKVYYVDYGFTAETSGTNLLQLHQDFLCLPFQATNVKLAGLEAISSHPAVLSCLDKLAVGKILLMETLESCQQNEMPVVVLYDTSQDDDVNINSTCLKSLQDKTMNNPLTINSTYQEVCVTNVCADGTIYCQLPSRGTAKLSKLLEETEAIFIAQVTSESLVSRPFSGKLCLARDKGKWSRVVITNMYNNRVMEILFIDLGVTATVEVTDLREIPPLLLRGFIFIPPQTTKCRLADVTAPEGDWSAEGVLWLKEAVLGCEHCKMKILRLDQQKEDWLVYMYLFINADSLELKNSINHQLAHSEIWHKLAKENNNNNNNNKIISNSVSADTDLSSLVEKLTLGNAEATRASIRPKVSLPDEATKTGQQLRLPPPLELPQPGQNVDVFVPVACHPGHFVLQQWQDLHKMMVLMGEMILYYNQTWKSSKALNLQKGEIYAARIDGNWHRVQVKGILTNGLVSVYELDQGKHELVQRTVLQPLIDEFTQLPFQAITAQLAGVTHHQWSEEASMLFRNHVENRALVAQVEGMQVVEVGKGEPMDRRLIVYLVDTTSDDKDLWIHSIMEDLSGELSSAA